jgi:hypothetical protein
VVIFVKNVGRAKALNTLLNQCNFPSQTLFRGMQQDERLRVSLRRTRQLLQRCGMQCCALRACYGGPAQPPTPNPRLALPLPLTGRPLPPP